MTLAITPNEDDIYAAVKAYILGILPLDNAHVVKGVQNRAAMPTGPFAEMYIATAKRIHTNQDTWDPNDSSPTGITRESAWQLEMQVSLYGPASSDWGRIFAALWRDDYACQALAPTCAPLHSDTPARAPLVTGEEQYLDKWLVRAQLQYSPVITTVDQFASVVTVDIVNVDVKYPAT